MAVWNSVFLHEFLDGNPANLRALPGNLTVLPNGPVVEPTPDPANRGFRVAPGRVLGYQFQGALANVIGVDLSVDLVLTADAAFQDLTVLSLGGGAVTLAMPSVDAPGGRAGFRLTVDGASMDFTLSFVPSQTIRLRVRWHTHGQVQVWQERFSRAYQPGFAAGHTVGIGQLTVGGPIGRVGREGGYILARRVYVKLLRRDDSRNELGEQVDIDISVKTGTLIKHFDPPVVHIDAGEARRVLGSGAKAADAMADPDLNRSAVFTYGARLEAAREFFGASNTVAGATEPTPGDPRRPRHLPIVVRAELRMLLETLKHELELDDLPDPLEDSDQPIDAIWSGFAVEESFFIYQSSGPGPAFTRPDKREVLRALVAAHLAGDAAAWQAALNQIPPGWGLYQRAWDAVTQYAFLEFYFVYAFNDYKEYGTWPFENEHEGDVEGCCIVFERSELEELAAGTKTAAQVTAHTVITSVHEEFHDSDCLKRLPLANDKARDDLVVYVAPGSHATYLTPGSHDILDFEDVLTDLPSEIPTWVVALAIITGNLEILVALVLLAAIIEHFVDSEDETSDNGVSVGPGEPDPANLKFEKKIEVTPLSNILTNVNNIYQAAFRPTRAIRGYHGKWGGDDGLVSYSESWENKTARYFRRFLKDGQIKPSVVIV